MKKGWLIAGGGAAALVAVLVGARVRGQSKGGDGDGKGARAGADRVVPVLVARVATRDVPLVLEGLGTVTAYKTVNVRPQVDGRLDKVTFVEGQAVKKGELLAQIDPRPFTIQLHTAQAALARDQAQLHGAELNLQRYQTVVEQHLIPQQQVDDQRALVEQYRASTQSDQAQIENARLQLDYARVTSPIDGVTGVRLVDPGNLVHASDAGGLVVVTQLDPIAVLFTLAQDDLPRVAKYRVAGALSVDAMSRDGTQKLATGQLLLVDNQINQNTATIRLKAIFPNPQHALWPNQFVKARLQLTVRKGVQVVPAVAVQHGPQNTFVYVASAGDQATVAIKPVVVESIEGDAAILSKGVEVGDAVVIEGQSQLKPGARVALRESGGAGPGPGPGGAGGGHVGGQGRPGAGGNGARQRP
jgi:multidrug efflux system membrane fusion protein